MFRNRLPRAAALAAALVLSAPSVAGAAPSRPGPPGLPGSDQLPVPSSSTPELPGSDAAPSLPGSGSLPGLPGSDSLPGSSQGAPSIDRGTPPAGSVRAGWSAPGPHPVAAETEPSDCRSLAVRIYNRIVTEQHGVLEEPQCYDVFPNGTQPPAGTKWLMPADLAEGEKAPLIVLSPGIAGQPGHQDRIARHLASHGYVVVVGFTFVNWFGAQVNIGALAAAAAAEDASHPLHGHIDFSRTGLVGHSAGGGAVLSMSSALERILGPVIPDLHVGGVVALMPGPGDFGLATPPGTAPTLVAVAEHESMVPHGLSRQRYDQLAGPGWWVEMRDTYHGTALDIVPNTPVGGLTLSFLDAQLRGDVRAETLYEGPAWTLPSDPELMDVERNAAAGG
ncbi:poly(ethylene terephthalate) hydrolase family protein [Corynebacterium sp. 335C]